MPLTSQALIGFMDQDRALAYMKNACIPSSTDDNTLIAEYIAAKAKITPAINAGQPDIQDIPPAGLPHVSSLVSAPWFQYWISGPFLGAQFKLVEIEPLLAWQFAIGTQKSNEHCHGLSNPPTLTEMLDISLPIAEPKGDFQVQRLPQSFIVKSANLNLRGLAAGQLNDKLAGLLFDFAPPQVHVTRFNGRCYLYNGFHRAYGIRLAGGTHVPCIFRDVPDAEASGIRSDWSTFPLSIMESTEPPTIGHFTRGQGHPVEIRNLTRILHVSWAEYAMPEE